MCGMGSNPYLVSKILKGMSQTDKGQKIPVCPTNQDANVQGRQRNLFASQEIATFARLCLLVFFIAGICGFCCRYLDVKTSPFSASDLEAREEESAVTIVSKQTRKIIWPSNAPARTNKQTNARLMS